MQADEDFNLPSHIVQHSLCSSKTKYLFPKTSDHMYAKVCSVFFYQVLFPTHLNCTAMYRCMGYYGSIPEGHAISIVALRRVMMSDVRMESLSQRVEAPGRTFSYLSALTV